LAENKTKQRDVSTDILKGISILLMIMGHSSFGDFVSQYKAAFNMPTFFFISGYFFSIHKYNSFGVFIQKKVKSLIIPYCTFALLTVLICVGINLFFNEQIYLVSDMLKGIVWSNQDIFPITGAIWFLQCLFIIEVLFYIFIKHMSTGGIVYTISLCGVFAEILSQKGVHFPFSIDSALSGIVFFGIGFFYNRYIGEGVRKRVNKMHVILFLLITNTILILSNKGVNPRTCEYGIESLFYFNAFVAIFVYWDISVYLSYLQGKMIVIKKILTDIGKDSIIYLGLNQILFKGYYSFFNLFIPANQSWVKASRNILCFAITCVTIYIMNQFVSNRKIKVLLGR
jgi:acyltransferase